MTTAVHNSPVTMKPGECTATKIANNPLVTTVAATALSAGFWTVCGEALLVTAACSPVGLLALGGANVVLLGAYVCEHKKELAYEVSLIFSAAQSAISPTAYAWWNDIDSDLYLGRIPLHEHGHLEALPKLGNQLAILSMLEPFELEDRYLFTTAIAHAEWKKLDISTLQLPAVDFESVSIDHLMQAVQFIRDMRAQGKTVYVHCKAGVGRSATVMACYLLAEGLSNGRKFTSPEEVIQYIQSKRPNVTIHRDPGKKAIVAFFDHLRTLDVKP